MLFPSMACVLVIPLSFQQFQFLFHLRAAHLRVAYRGPYRWRNQYSDHSHSIIIGYKISAAIFYHSARSSVHLFLLPAARIKMVKKTQSAYDTIKHGISKTWQSLVITHKSQRLRESGLLGECAPQILRCAQDDSSGLCHPERSEGSLADLWRITGAISWSSAPNRRPGPAALLLPCRFPTALWWNHIMEKTRNLER